MSKILVVQHNFLIDSTSKEEFNTFDKQMIAKAISLIHQEDIELKDNFIDVDRLYERCYGSKLKICPARDKVFDRLEDLVNKKITVRSLDGSKKPKTFSWLSKFTYDKETKKAHISINEEAVDYLINLDGKFKGIKLDKYLDMDSVYSMRLMEIMSIIFGNAKERKFEINTLRGMLYVGNKYRKLYDFKKLVIEPAIKEVNKHTNLNLSYQQEKVGRKVKYIKFIKDGKGEAHNE